MGITIKRSIALILALGAAFTASPSAGAQGKGKRSQSAPGTHEPLRVISAQMRGHTIAGQFTANGRRSNFTFALSKGEIIDGKLQLRGEFRLGREQSAGEQSAGEEVTAGVAGVMAKADNPWPDSSDSPEPEKADEQKQGREAKNPETAAQLGQLSQSTQDTARKTPKVPAERNEQTQSLYAQAAAGTSCGVFFLSLDLPERLRTRMGAISRPVQIGVVLAPFDNRPGEEVNKRLCAIVRMSGDKSKSNQVSASIDELNRFLASSR
jgi:hypothetical protein